VTDQWTIPTPGATLSTGNPQGLRSTIGGSRQHPKATRPQQAHAEPAVPWSLNSGPSGRPVSATIQPGDRPVARLHVEVLRGTAAREPPLDNSTPRSLIPLGNNIEISQWPGIRSSSSSGRALISTSGVTNFLTGTSQSPPDPAAVNDPSRVARNAAIPGGRPEYRGR
jgi:hypothetical protein